MRAKIGDGNLIKKYIGIINISHSYEIFAILKILTQHLFNPFINLPM